MSKELWSRWHCYDSNNKKLVKRFEINEVPETLPGHTIWMRGTGPHTPQARQNIGDSVRRVCLGVPKSESQKMKMSLAKKGKPKSLEHRKNMSIAHKQRIQNKRNEQSISTIN